MRHLSILLCILALVLGTGTSCKKETASSATVNTNYKVNQQDTASSHSTSGEHSGCGNEHSGGQ